VYLWNVLERYTVFLGKTSIFSLITTLLMCDSSPLCSPGLAGPLAEHFTVCFFVLFSLLNRFQDPCR
jgi:hypothetical protein